MVEVRIVFTHTHNTDSFYDVYANHHLIGILTDQLSSGFRFEAKRNISISTYFHTFNSLDEAIEKLPVFLPHWIAESVLIAS